MSERLSTNEWTLTALGPQHSRLRSGERVRKSEFTPCKTLVVSAPPHPECLPTETGFVLHVDNCAVDLLLEHNSSRSI
jgi:hypothetical protein